MNEKKIEIMLDDLNEALQRHITYSTQTKSFVMPADSGYSYIALELISQGSEIEVETTFILSDVFNMECDVFIDGQNIRTYSTPIEIFKASVTKGKHTLEIVARDTVIAGKVSVSGIISSINAVS